MLAPRGRVATGMVAIGLTLMLAEAAQADCGYAHLRPAKGRLGAAPLALGDSVMLGAARQLRRAGLEVEARCARPTGEGLALMQRRRRAGTLPGVVVFALGTNIRLSRSEIARALHIIGPNRALVLVTPLRAWHAFGGAAMRRAARRRPHRISLVDWSRRARGNGRWLWGDGTHLRPEGAEAYTRLIRREVWRRGSFGRRAGATVAGWCRDVRIRPKPARIGAAPLAIGDSVMGGAGRQLAAGGLEVDAHCGRSPDGGLYVLRNRLRKGTLPQVVVIALGTNFFMESRHISRALRIPGPRRTLVLVTPFRSWRPVGTGAIRTAAIRRPRRVKLADWSSLASGRNYWFTGDGTHLRRSGARAYAGLIRRVVWGTPRGHIGRGT